MKINKSLKGIIIGSATAACFVFVNQPLAQQDGLIPEDAMLSPPEIDAMLETRVKELLWDNLNSGPDGNLLGNDSVVSFQIYDKSEKVNLDYGLATSVRPARTDDGYHSVWSYKLSASAPSNKDDDGAPLPTLDSMKDAFTVGFSASFSLIPVNSSAFDALSENSEAWATERERLAPLVMNPGAATSEECSAAISGLPDFTNLFNLGTVLMGDQNVRWEDIDELSNMTYWEAIQYVVKRFEGQQFNDEERQEVLDDLRRFVANPADSISPDTHVIKVCAPEFFNTYLAKYVDLSWTADRWSHTFSFKAEVGNEEFDYLDPMSFKNQEVTKQIESYTALWGLNKAGNRGSQNFTLSYSYQKGFVAPAQTTMCLNGGANPEADCKSAIFGSPVSKDRSLISIEGSGRLEGFSGNNPISFKLKATRDIENDVTGLDLPIYLFSIAGEDLDSGIRLGWQDETDDVTVGIFYQSKF